MDTRGLYGKYIVSRKDGKPIGQTITIEPWKDPDGPMALRALASAYEYSRPEFFNDLIYLAGTIESRRREEAK